MASGDATTATLKRVVELGAAAAAGAAVTAAVLALLAPDAPDANRGDVTPTGARDPKQVASEFFEAQSQRDLDKMCDLVADDVLYINEPHRAPVDAAGGRARTRARGGLTPRASPGARHSRQGHVPRRVGGVPV